MPSARRQLIADTALHVLATDGARGLTHRAVDLGAGLPAGSTSYYYRSRAALLNACVDRLVERDLAQLQALEPVFAAGDPHALADVLADGVIAALTSQRDQHLARFELTLESVRRPEVAARLRGAGQVLRERIAEVLGRFGAAEPDRQARLLVALVDGILFENIAGADAGAPIRAADVRAALREVLAAILAPHDG